SFSCVVLLPSAPPPRALPSFPTRRSSDLALDVEVRGPAEAIQAALQAIPEVLSVAERANGKDATVFAIECTAGSDIRERIASTIVQRGWGLRELRAANVSLEDVFVQLVTSEPAAAYETWHGWKRHGADPKQNRSEERRGGKR